MPVVTLLSDFGLADHYVAAMKGVILQIAPKAEVVDVTHQIAPQNVLQAAFVLRQVFDCFAPGTIHVVVVDPGVGTNRRIIAARYSGRMVLAPDNGVVSVVHHDFALEELRVVENTKLFRPTVSATFHGRDIFAPVAGHLARTSKFAEVGRPIDRLALLDVPSSRVEPDGRIIGQIIYIDQFGNAATNVTREDVALATRRRSSISVRVGEHNVGPLRGTYSDVAAGEPVALIGSAEMLEIAVCQASAAKRLELSVGQEVYLG